MTLRWTWKPLVAMACCVVAPGCATWKPANVKAVPGGNSAARTATSHEHSEQPVSKTSGPQAIPRAADQHTKQQCLDAIARHPQHPAPYQRLAVLHARESNFAEANRHFEKALQLAEPSVEILSNYGYCLYLQKRWTDAERMLRLAERQKPNHEATCNNLGLVVGAQGRYTESLEIFQRVNNKDAAQANLAYVFSQHGDPKTQHQAYQEALARDEQPKPANVASAAVVLRPSQPAPARSSTESQARVATSIQPSVGPASMTTPALPPPAALTTEPVIASARPAEVAMQVAAQSPLLANERPAPNNIVLPTARITKPAIVPLVVVAPQQPPIAKKADLAHQPTPGAVPISQPAVAAQSVDATRTSSFIPRQSPAPPKRVAKQIQEQPAPPKPATASAPVAKRSVARRDGEFMPQLRPEMAVEQSKSPPQSAPKNEVHPVTVPVPVAIAPVEKPTPLVKLELPAAPQTRDTTPGAWSPPARAAEGADREPLVKVIAPSATPVVAKPAPSTAQPFPFHLPTPKKPASERILTMTASPIEPVDVKPALSKPVPSKPAPVAANNNVSDQLISLRKSITLGARLNPRAASAPATKTIKPAEAQPPQPARPVPARPVPVNVEPAPEISVRKIEPIVIVEQSAKPSDDKRVAELPPVRNALVPIDEDQPVVTTGLGGFIRTKVVPAQPPTLPPILSAEDYARRRQQVRQASEKNGR